MSVVITPCKDSNGYFRTACVRFVPEKILRLDNALVMMVGSNIAYKNMVKLKLDRTDPAVRPYVQNGTIYVPGCFFSENFKIKSISDEFIPLDTAAKILGKKVFINNGLIILSDYDAIFDSTKDKDLIDKVIKDFFD